MNAKNLLPKSGFLQERLWIWLTGALFWGVGVGLLALLTPIGQHLLTIWRSPEATTDALARINARMDEQGKLLAELRDGVRRATGEDRVIRQTPGLSYVSEPVYQGETVVLFMIAERTRLGRDCRLREWGPLFTDASGISVPGSPAIAGPVRRQIGIAPTRLRIEMTAPPTLQPGRIELYLVLTYDCAGSPVYDRTDPVIYVLLAGARPD